MKIAIASDHAAIDMKADLAQWLRDEGHEVREERYGIDQWEADANSGRLKETLACGTAAVVTPVGTVKSRTGSFSIGGDQMGPVTAKLRSRLVEIQRGTAPDPHGWVMRV